ncbi:MAG: TRAP transporter small permease [Burkholderiaceae bacterium]
MSISRIPVLLSRIAVHIAEVLLVVLMGITVYAVVARYLFNAPSLYAMEISTYVLVAITWLSIGWVHYENRHVSVEFAEAKLSGTAKKIAYWITQCTVLLFSLVLVWAGCNVVLTAIEKAYKSPSLLKVPLWIPYSFIPLGAALLALIALSKFKAKPAHTPETDREI